MGAWGTLWGLDELQLKSTAVCLETMFNSASQGLCVALFLFGNWEIFSNPNTIREFLANAMLFPPPKTSGSDETDWQFLLSLPTRFVLRSVLLE